MKKVPFMDLSYPGWPIHTIFSIYKARFSKFSADFGRFGRFGRGETLSQPAWHLSSDRPATGRPSRVRTGAECSTLPGNKMGSPGAWPRVSRQRLLSKLRGTLRGI